MHFFHLKPDTPTSVTREWWVTIRDVYAKNGHAKEDSCEVRKKINPFERSSKKIQ